MIMKKDFKKLIVIIFIMLIITITACNDTKNEVVETDSLVKAAEKVSDKESIIDSDTESTTNDLSDSNEDFSPEMVGFLKNLRPDSTTADLKSYMEENIKYVSQEEAEKMLEYLLIYQTETIADFRIVEEFFDQVYDEMDESILETISNENLKAGYKELLDSALMIKFSEYHAYVTTDWKSLQKFSPYLPEDYKTLFDLYSKIDSKAENQAYDPERVDITNPGEDIIKTETMVKNNTSSFFKKIANDLYEVQIYNLLLGPEASHVYFWSEKDGREYSDLIDMSSSYPKSKFAEIINEIDKRDIEDSEDITEIIEKYLTFGLESNKYLETLNYSEGRGEYNLVQIKIPEDEEKEKNINNIIKKTIDNYIEENIDGDFYLMMDLKHADDRYISYGVYLDYQDSQGNENSTSFYKTLDYEDEKYITLEEYFGLSFDSMKAELERILGDEIDFSPEFVLFPDEIHLIAYNQKGENGFLNLKDLVPFMH